MSSPGRNAKRNILWILAFIVCGVAVYFCLPMLFGGISYDSNASNSLTNGSKDQNTLSQDQININNEKQVLAETMPSSDIPVTHITTPDTIKSVYVSSWVAGSQNFRDNIIKIIDTTELNAIVIDIKDSTGRVGFYINDPDLISIGSYEKRIPNIRALTSLLHSKNIYIIGRVSVFQDPYLSNKKPEWAITRKSDGGVWKDRKGLSFLDPANKEVQDYVVKIARDSYSEGFDEINFDYVRYPSDGDMNNINYHLAEGRTRADNIESFFKYLSSELKKDVDIPISADLFGLTTEAKDDMGIGQVWEKAIPHFDFIDPMVYPSHYPPGTDGYKNPAAYPYEVVNKALASAVARTKAMGEDTKKIRPWLQDFDLGATYTKEMVRAQMKATYDNGLTSWMLWDPSNKYTPSALLLENN